MKLSYLIDTDWIIDHLSGISATTEKLEELKSEGLGISIISLAEIYEGVYYSKNPVAAQEGVEYFLKDIAVIEVNQNTCKTFGKERGRLRKQGNLIDDFDLLIAATCLSHNLTLLSNNRKHFERITGLQIISLKK